MLVLHAPIVIGEDTMIWIPELNGEKNKNKTKNQNQQVLVVCEIENKEKLETEMVAAVRRGRDGEPLPKQGNLRDDGYHHTTRQIENIVGS